MPFNTTTYYALRAVAELAAAYGGASLKAPDIARAQGIPPKYLAAILNDLKKAGLVSARRGAAGGYQLARPPSAVTPGDVIHSIQGPVAAPLALEEGGGADGRDDAWMFESLWAAVQEAVDAVCRSTSFAELVEERRRRREHRVPDFVI